MSLERIIWGGLEAVQAARAGEPIGPSGHSGCFRAQAYGFLGVSRTDVVSTDAADAGTIYHDGLTYRIKTAPDYDPAKLDADVRITIPGVPRAGKADVVDYERRICWDCKTMGRDAYQARVNAGGPYPDHWHQLNLYVRGLVALHGGEWSCGILMVNRDTGARSEWVQAYDPDDAERLANKIAGRHESLVAAANVALTASSEADVVALAETFPREGRGPGSFPCGWCPWQTGRCWPQPTAGDRTPQSETVKDDESAIGFWVNEYLEASGEASKADGRKKDARMFLAGLEGVFPLPDGGLGKVGYTGGKELAPVPDPEAMRERLVELGEVVPVKDGGTTRRAISVNRVKK